MSFYDEFIDGLNNSSASTAEIKEEELDDVENTEVSDVHDDESLDDVISMESYHEYMKPIVEEFLDNLAPVVEGFIAGEISESEFNQSRNDIISEYNLEGNDYLSFAGEGLFGLKSRKERAIDATQRRGAMGEERARSILKSIEPDFLFVKAHQSDINKYLNNNVNISGDVKYASNNVKKFFGTAVAKAKSGVKNTVGIWVNNAPVNRNTYAKLYSKANNYFTDIEGTVTRLSNGVISEKDIRADVGNLRMIAEKAIELNKRGDIKEAKDAKVQAKYEAQKLRRIEKAGKKTNSVSRIDSFFRACQSFTDSLKADRATRKEGQVKSQILKNLTDEEILQLMKRANGNVEKAVDNLKSYKASTEGLTELWCNNPEVAYAYESYMDNLAFLMNAALEGNVEIRVEEPEEVPQNVDDENVNDEDDNNQQIESEDSKEETIAEESVIEVSDDEILDSAMESTIFLDALKATCTPEEFKQILSENATELQLYGIVDPIAIAKESYEEGEDDEEIATEARSIVRLSKEAKINTEEARIAIGLAKKSKDPLYTSYKKHSTLKRQFRDKIYAKYGSRAKPLARKALSNGRNRAAMMNSPAGVSIVSKIDSRLKQLNKSARNMTAIKPDVKAVKPNMGKKQN